MEWLRAELRQNCKEEMLMTLTKETIIVLDSSSIADS